jgi:Uma2 family endonuclease
MAMAFRADLREEFVNGRTVELPSPSPRHCRLIECLSGLLTAQVDRNSFKVLTTAYALGIEPGSGACRNPDLTVFRTDDLRRARIEGNNIFAIPLLIAECLSPRDRKGPLPELLDDYRRMRAKEVWIIDPHVRAIERHWFSGPPRTAEATGGPLVPAEMPFVQIASQDLWDAFDGTW